MNAKTKIRNECQQLNIKIAYHEKVIKQNTKAGQKFTNEYINWLQDLIKYRNSLTNQF